MLALGHYFRGSGNITEGGRAEGLLEKPAAGVRRRAPDHYSRGSRVAKEGARGGVAGGGVTAGADRRRDERCRDRKGERRSHGRGQEQALLEGRTPALLEGGRRNYQRGRAPVLAQGATVGATGGTAARVTGDHEVHHYDHRCCRRYHRFNRCPCSECYMQLSCEGSSYGGRSTLSTPTPGYSPNSSTTTTAARTIAPAMPHPILLPPSY